MPVRIRPFSGTDADFEAWVQVSNAAFPEYPQTVEQMKERDEAREERVCIERFVAERDGDIVGNGSWHHMSFLFHPRRLGLDVAVRPDEHGRGIGRLLFDTILDSAESDIQPVSLRAMCREDRTRAVRFLADRGFEVEARGFESRLDLTTFDASQFDGAEQRVLDGGIRLATLAEAPDEAGLETWLRGIYDVDCEACLDIPCPEPITMEPWDAWRKHVVSSRFIDRGMHIALDGDRIVGVSMLFKSTEPHMLSTGLTGVLRAYRRRGIALALKLRAMAMAREAGATMVRTHNDEPNRAMLSINEAMGFEKEPAFLDYYRSVRPDEDEHLARRAAAAAAAETAATSH